MTDETLQCWYCQITELRIRPTPEKIERIRNPPTYSKGDIVAWLTSGRYTGNKPIGGLWTSTHTPNSEYISDWQYGRQKNAFVRLAYPATEPLQAYTLAPRRDAKALHIETLDDALRFTSNFHLSTVPIPDTLRVGLGITITTELTDWQRAFLEYDGIHLTETAADEIMWAAVHDNVVTAFHTWNCESTLWGKWAFDEM